MHNNLQYELNSYCDKRMEQNVNECDGPYKSDGVVDNTLNDEICFEDTLELIMRNNKDKDPFDSRRVYKKQKVY